MGKGFSNYRKQVLGGGGGMPNMQQLMEQAQKMQQDLEEAKAKIAEAEFEGTSGGDAVKVTLSGEKKLVSLQLKPEIVDPEDVEMLEDLIIAAYNDAFDKAEKFTQETMPSGTEGLI